MSDGEMIGRQPAFPFSTPEVVQMDGKVMAWRSAEGMTLREYVATHALAGLLANSDMDPKTTAQAYARQAVMSADLLLAELAKPKAEAPKPPARHVHEASQDGDGTGDRCAKCGKDIRDPIHLSQAEFDAF